MTVRWIKATLDLTDVAGLAFTSTNGVKAFAAQENGRDLPVFAVGDATAKAAQMLGFTDVRSADGDVGDLCRLIVSAEPKGLILNPGGAETAGDFIGHLKRHGVLARQVALYDTPAVANLSPELTRSLGGREVAAVLVHSPRAAAILAGEVQFFDLTEVAALGLSSHCLRPLRHLSFGRLVRAKRPREDALLDALLATLGNSAGDR